MFLRNRDVPRDPKCVVLKTYACEPKWPQRCVVCDQFCEGSGKIIRVETGINNVPVGRAFFVPLHIAPRDCKAIFSRKYFWRVYSGYLVGLIWLGLFLSTLYMTKLSGVTYMVFLFGLVVAQTINGIYAYSKPIEVKVREVSGAGGMLEHEFKFMRETYADEFRELNAAYLD